MKNIKYYTFMLFTLFIPSIIFASDYKVDSYDVTIDVSEKRNYIYKEDINIIFEKANVVVEKELDSQIKDFKLNTNYISETKDTKLIKINSKNNSSSNYTFDYSFLKKDYDKDIYEIDITNTFNNTLNNITFYINIEEDFNKRNVDIFINGKETDAIKYNIKDKKIEGKIPELKQGDIVTVKIDYTKLYLTTTTTIATIIPVILTLISGILWYLYGKDLKYKTAKSYELPENLNSLELGLIKKGVADESDTFALLIELANQGYIKIVENNTNEYSLKRGNEYDGKDYKVSMFLKSLFRKSTSVTLADYINIVAERKKDKSTVVLDKTIKSENLYQRFQRAKNIVLPIVNEKEEKNKYFERTSERKKSYLILILATILIILTSVPFIEINKLYLLPISVLFSIITLYILMNFTEHMEFKMNKKNLLIFVFLALVVLIIMLLPAFRRNRIYLITFLVCFICIVAILFFYKYMPKRTLFGTKKYSSIESFKNFILADNKKDYDILMERDKQYLFNILAPCYVLGLEKEVFRKMKEYKVKCPSWFETDTNFTITKFENSLDRLYKTLKEKSEE